MSDYVCPHCGAPVVHETATNASGETIYRNRCPTNAWATGWARTGQDPLGAYSEQTDFRATSGGSAAVSGPHTHPTSDVVGLDAALAAKADDADLTGVIREGDARLADARLPLAHQHPTADVTGLDTALAGKAATTHTHPELPTTGQKNALAGTSGTPGSTNTYVTTQDGRLTDARTPTAHAHPISDVTGLQTVLDGKAATTHTHTRAQITDFTHGHAIADVTGLQTVLDAKLDDAQLGAANGVASLGADGKVPAAQLPASSGGAATANVADLNLWNDGATNLTFTNLPLAGVEVGPNNRSRKFVDLTTAANFRVGGVLVTAAAVAAKIRVDYSIDGGTNWATLKETTATADPDMPMSGALGARIGTWAAVATGARRDVLVRAYAYNGDGVVDPVVASIYVQFK